jgi:FkbM family methyltransferase
MKKLSVTAHGHTYSMYALPGLGSGKAPGKVIACMRVGKPYERPLLEHIYRLGLTGLAVDVGANVGNHTMWLAAVCGLHVAAFEPIVPMQLQSNVVLNNLEDRVDIYPDALGAVNGEYLKHVGEGKLRKPRNNGSHADIRIHTLDSYKLEDVTLIKIDVEGMEAAVLRGGEETIRRDRPVIFAEEWAGNPKWHRQIAAVLEPWGYHMTERLHGRESATPVGKWEPK